MNILITGANGFIGKNLVSALESIRGGDDASSSPLAEPTLFKSHRDTPSGLLDEYCRQADFVFHLAGVNRAQSPGEFETGNPGFTSVLLETLKKHGNKSPVVLASSIRAVEDTPYGRSKKACEDLAFDYAAGTDTSVFVYRLPNVFGKWCRPGYNSAVATFCHNIARGLPISVNDPKTRLNLVYIDDVVGAFIRALTGNPTYEGPYCAVPEVYSAKLGDIAELLYGFKTCREKQTVPELSDPFTAKLHATYLSHLPEGALPLPLVTNADARGSFTELLRTPDRGQFSVNVTKPGVTKGNHWHRTKTEKFAVASGAGVLRLRKIGCDTVVEYAVAGASPELVDIPPGYAHSIENTGTDDLVTFIWASERFDPSNPDTYPEQV